MTEMQGAVLTFSMPLIVIGIWRAVFILGDIVRRLPAPRDTEDAGS